MPFAPPTKSMRLSVRTSWMPRIGRQQPLLQNVAVEPVDDARARHAAALQIDRYASVRPHTSTPRPSLEGSAGPDVIAKCARDLAKEMLRRHAVQIAHHAVVRKNAHLI